MFNQPTTPYPWNMPSKWPHQWFSSPTSSGNMESSMVPWIPPWCHEPFPCPPPWMSRNRDGELYWHFSLLPETVKEKVFALMKKEMESHAVDEPDKQVQPKAALDLSSLSGTTLVIGSVGEPSPQRGFGIASGNSTRIEIPKNFTLDQVQLATKDSEILGDILKNHPQEISQMIDSFSAGNLTEATKIAKNLGFSEQNFTSNGGGMWAVVIVIAIACAVLLKSDNPQ